MMPDPSFQDELLRQPVDVLRAALRFARAIAYPRLDVAACVEQVEVLAEQARRWLLQGGLMQPRPERRWISTGLSDCQKAELLSDFLFTQQGFRGNGQAYNDPRNSYLNEVLDRRLGIPISLSALYVAVAQRLDIPAQGVGLPGHYIVRAAEDCYLDPYHGGERLSLDDCARLVAQTTGGSTMPGTGSAEYGTGRAEYGTGRPFNRDWLQPVSPEATLTRMLNNLRASYLEREDWPHALRVVEHLRMLHPQLPDLLRDLGWIYQRQGVLSKAAEHYGRYLNLAPGAEDAVQVQRILQAAVKKLAERN
jgi:regulator of sirC expression with transglutaminase-like and TPR domain